MSSELIRAVLVALAFLLGSCSENPQANGHGKTVESIFKLEAYEPFPAAASVRLVARPEPFDSDDLDRVPDSKGRLLTSSEATTLASAFKKLTVTRPGTEECMFTACAFSPRHVFRYYDKNGKRLGEVLICLECFDVQIRPEGSISFTPCPGVGKPSLHLEYPVLEGLLRRMNVPTYGV